MNQLREVSIEIIRKCPNSCVHCSSCSSINRSELIPYNLFCNIIDDAAKLGLKTICFSGGEPFLHPDFCEMITYAYEAGIDIYIYTSGIYIQNNKVCSIPLEILKTIRDKVSKLIFNIEASSSSTYDIIMGTQGYFPLLLESISKAIKHGIVCEAHFVPMRYNYSEIDSTINLCQEIGISKISFLRLVPHGRAEINKKDIMLNYEETEKLKQKLHDVYTCRKEIGIRIGTPLSGNECQNKCEAATEKLNIKYDGGVYPCEVFKNKKVQFIDDIEPDNIYEKNLIDIYNNSEYLSIIRNHLKKYFHTIKEENCIGQHYINSIKEDT